MIKFICSKCKKKEAVKILYGYPADETLQSWFKKEVELGGCIIQPNNPNRKCLNCGHQWRTKN